MSELSEKIIRLRANGKTYAQIRSELGCSTSLISYYVGEGQKEKTLDRQRKRRSSLEGAVKHKTNTFSAESKKIYSKTTDFHRNGDRSYGEKNFTFLDVIEKYGETTTCYLTGDVIDLAKPSEYEFDHKTPRSRGGNNSFENLGISTREANRAKGTLTVDEFLNLCEKVLRHHGRI